MNSTCIHPQGNYSLDKELRATNLDIFKLYISYGTFDKDGERYFNRLKTIFEEKGKEYEFTIVGDGHTWQNWSRVIKDELVYFYPKGNSMAIDSDINQNQLFSLYPNPTREGVSVSINIDIPNKIDIAIFSIAGYKVLEKKNLSSGKFDISGLKKDLYIVVKAIKSFGC